MKKSIWFIGLILSAFAGWSAVITDNFDRADQGSSADGSLIGSHWLNSDAEDRWALSSGSLRSVTVSTPAILFNDELETGNIADRNFTLSVDVSGKESNAWAGVVFNYQDSTNYYVLRFKVGTTSYQLNRVVNGSTGGPVFATDATATFVDDVFYTVTISSISAYEFDFTITEVGSSAVLNPITNAVDTNQNFTDGYAGVYNTGVLGWTGAYDNFLIEATPRPGPSPLITDNFDRVDTSYETGGSSVSSYWMNSDSSDQWKISGSNLFLNVQSDPAILYNAGLSTVSGNGTNFILSVDVAANVTGGWAGVVFNYQDPLNYYQLRIKGGSSSYQLNRVVNGGAGGPVFASDATTPFAVGSFYTLTVTSTNAYEFDFTITDAGSSTPLNPTASAIDVNANFAGGFAGVYSPTASGATDPDATFDNFSLERITDSGPLPATIVDVSVVSGNLLKIAIDTPGSAVYYAVKTSSNLTLGIWSDVPHSDDGINAFVVTNLAYSTLEGEYEVIYVETDAAKSFFGIGSN